MFQTFKINYGSFLLGLQIEAMYRMVCSQNHLLAASHWDYRDFAKVIREFNSKLPNSEMSDQVGELMSFIIACI